MTRPSDGDLRTDTVLRNTYKIASVLGRGGMGSVYLAQHLRLPGKQVAVKVLRGGDHLTQEIFTRFRREAEIASRLGHPNIVEVLDYDTLEDGTPFLVLEFLRGESLQSRLERGRLPLDEVFSYTRQMGSALQAAHGAGIVHRDLKPANVFLVPTDSGGVVGQRVKLLDFGISKVLSSETLQTQEQTIIGTPQYMSPEQAMGKNREIDARTDIFALGCIVYEMMSGKPVFGAGSLAQMIFRVVYEPADPLAPLCPEAPQHAIAAVERALAKSPDDRFPDVTSFVEALTGSRLHTLSPQSGAQAAPRPVPPPRAVSGIALPTDAGSDDDFGATIAPGSRQAAPDTGRMNGIAPVGQGPSTGRMGMVQPENPMGGTGRMGMVQPENPMGGTGRMGMVQPEHPSMAAPLADPPSLEPTLISKQVPAVPMPARPPQPITAVTPPQQAVPQEAFTTGQHASMASAQSMAQPMPTAQSVAVAPAQAQKGRGPLVAAAAVALFVAGGGVVWWMGRPQVTPTAPETTQQAAATPPSSGTSAQQVIATPPPSGNTVQPPPAGTGTGTQVAAVQPLPTTTPTVQNAATPDPTSAQTIANATQVQPATNPRKTRAEPAEQIPDHVKQILEEGERALKADKVADALEAVRRAQSQKITKAAYSLQLRAKCRQDDKAGAEALWRKLASSERTKVQKYCINHGIDPVDLWGVP